jgi:hypothetical protein
MNRKLCPECGHLIGGHKEKGCLVVVVDPDRYFCKCMCTPDDVIDKIITESIIEWIVLNVSANDVPGDEGNDDALVYNLVHNAMKDDKQYTYLPEQDAEIKALYAKYGRDEGWEPGDEHLHM